MSALAYANYPSYGWPMGTVRQRRPVAANLSDLPSEQSAAEPSMASVFSSPAEPSWLSGSFRRLIELTSLPENWDMHGGQPARSDIANFVLTFMFQALDPETPAPFISPLSYGGIQIEWHEKSIDLEVEFVSPNNLVINFSDSVSGESIEDLEMSTDFRLLAGPIAELTHR